MSRRPPHNPPVMLQCPHCGGSDSKVIATRGTLYQAYVYRRRKCKACHARFSTRETIIESADDISANPQ